MIFLTVGTEFPFDRLVRTIDEILAKGELKQQLFAQIGHSQYVPRNMTWVSTMEREHFKKTMKECDAVISHAGIGTIISCLGLNKPLLVMPRLRCYKEISGDHQIATARRFERLGYFLVAYSAQDLGMRLEQLQDFHPSAQRAVGQRLTDYIKGFLEGGE